MKKKTLRPVSVQRTVATQLTCRGELLSITFPLNLLLGESLLSTPSVTVETLP